MEIAVSVLKQEQARGVRKASYYSNLKFAGSSMTLVFHIHFHETKYLDSHLQSLPLANGSTSMKVVLQLSFPRHMLPHINLTMHLYPPSHLCSKFTKIVFGTACCFTGNIQEHLRYYPGGGKVRTD